jgi:hypothetical protein
MFSLKTWHYNENLFLLMLTIFKIFFDVIGDEIFRRHFFKKM